MGIKEKAKKNARRIGACVGAGIMLLNLNACAGKKDNRESATDKVWSCAPEDCVSAGGHDYSGHLVETIKTAGDKKVCEYILYKKYDQCVNCGDIAPKTFDSGKITYLDDNGILKEYEVPNAKYTIEDYIEYKVAKTIPHSIKNPDNLTGVCENCGKEVRATKFNLDNCKYNSYELVD